MKSLIVVFAALVTAALNAQEPSSVKADSPVWLKGNIHTHSFWSDGNQFPEMIASWYKQKGYDFLALTDHNVLSKGEKWMPLSTLKARGGDDILENYISAFGGE